MDTKDDHVHTGAGGSTVKDDKESTNTAGTAHSTDASRTDEKDEAKERKDSDGDDSGGSGCESDGDTSDDDLLFHAIDHDNKSHALYNASTKWLAALPNDDTCARDCKLLKRFVRHLLRAIAFFPTHGLRY